jgi:hypothetical protein
LRTPRLAEPFACSRKRTNERTNGPASSFTTAGRGVCTPEQVLRLAPTTTPPAPASATRARQRHPRPRALQQPFCLQQKDAANARGTFVAPLSRVRTAQCRCGILCPVTTDAVFGRVWAKANGTFKNNWIILNTNRIISVGGPAHRLTGKERSTSGLSYFTTIVFETSAFLEVVCVNHTSWKLSYFTTIPPSVIREKRSLCGRLVRKLAQSASGPNHMVTPDG